MREVFVTRPAGALTRARQQHIDQITSDRGPHPKRTQSDSVVVAPNRYTPKRVIVTKRPLHTPFELRKPKIIKRPKSTLCRQKPINRNTKPVTSSRRNSATSTTLSPIPDSFNLEAHHLPSTPVPPSCQGSPSTTGENRLAPLTPFSPNNTDFFDLAPQELTWDDFSPTPSYIEFSNILEEALDQLYLQETLAIEYHPETVNNLVDSVHLDDDLPGTAANASTSTHNISVDLSTISVHEKTTMEETVLQHLQEYEECIMIEVECQMVVRKPAIYSIERIDNYLQLLDEKNASLRSIIAFFRTNPHPRVTQEIGNAMINLRMTMLSMIETLSEHRATHLRAQSAPTATGMAAANTDPRMQQAFQSYRPNSTTLALRQARVNLKRDPLLVEMDDISTKFMELKDNEVKQLGQFNKLNGHFKELLDKAQRTLHKAKSLCEDAMSTDMEKDALAIDSQSTALELEMSRAEAFIDLLRNKFGVPTSGYVNTQRSSNIPIPHFSGAKSDKFDLFTFKKKFQVYVDSMPSIADVEALEILKEKCLQGNAQLLCSAEKSIETCMKQLSFHYGSKTSIIAKRKSKIMELGPCPKFGWEQQIEWMVKLRSLLADTQEFARENNAENALYHGKTDIANSVLNLLKGDYFKEMSKIFLRSADDNGEEDGKFCYEQLLQFLDSELRIIQYQLNQHEGASQNAPTTSGNTNATHNNSSQRQQRGKSQSGTTAAPSTYLATEQAQPLQPRQKGKNEKTPLLAYTGPSSKPILTECVICQSQHTHLFQCHVYIATPPKEKRSLHNKTRACHRCLRMDANLDFDNIDEWWERHKNNCRTTFFCQTDNCQYAGTHRLQKHILACPIHAEQNKTRLDDFHASLPKDMQLPSGNLLFMDNITMSLHTSSGPLDHEDPSSLPDVEAPGIFMCQNIPDQFGNSVFVFFDSGCGAAAVSASAAARMNAVEHRPGPTLMNVAGGKVVSIPYGSDKIQLPISDSPKTATVIAAKMDTLTASFPKWELCQPYQDVANQYTGCEVLPTVPDVIGGGQVDIILGIKYNYLFPTYICSLPCGLSLYRSPLKGIDGHTGVLGGPHKAWARASETVNFVGAAIFFSNELSAYRSTTETLFNSGRSWCADVKSPYTLYSHHQTNLVETADSDSLQDVHAYNMDTQHIKKIERKFFETEDIGTQAPYRCINCRGCNDCKNGDILEATSLKEEAEQFLIKQSVKFKPEEQRIVATLPFIADPVKELKSNKSRALKVLESQLRKLQRDPDARQQVIESHEKLASRGYSCDIDELSAEERSLVDNLPGEYYLPWRYVTKEGSLSTPVRVVFDASATTSTGKSLNDVLAKGMNKLEKLLALDINFRAGPFAFACDIRMAYNQIQLQPSDFRWHKYLWVDNLDPSKPVRTRIMRTIIYGVKPSGNQTAEGLEQVAQYVIDKHPQHADGARILISKTYVDDASDATNTEEHRDKLITDVKFCLDLAGMEVKSFIRSSAVPEDTVSKDGKHVSYLGYRWAPLDDTLSIDVKPLFFGKVKRGKRPPPVDGNIEEALSENFTKRTILSKVASNYDLVGLYTPITAKFKADYHDLLVDAVGWDDGLPTKLLSTWVTNIEAMQSLADVTFPRSVIPADSLDKVDLLVSVDASQNMAIVCVHVRSTSLSGKVTVRLAAAKSKIVTGCTIPRAELRAAVAGTILANTVAKNLKNRVDKILFFTDSTVVLSWLHQDARPLNIGVRSCVIEIRRFSSPEQWRHVESENNIADLGTRFLATIDDISSSSEWQIGKDWMYLDYKDMPVKSFEDLQLSLEAKQAVAQEIRLLHIDTTVPKERTAELTKFSKYLYDPCQRSWPKAVRIMAIVIKFCFFNFKMFRANKETKAPIAPTRAIDLTDNDIQNGETYYFRLASKEVIKFSNPKSYGDNIVTDNGIMKYNGRIVEGTNIEDVENIMTDLAPLHFVRPIVDRYSPIAYAIMLHAHEDLALHRNVNATLLESRHIAYILSGRDLAKEIRTACPSCRKFKAKLLEVELGPVHKNRLTIAPPFYYCQLDLMGPFLAYCEHNHRSSVKVWGLVCRDPSSAATACFAMTKYNTDAFLQAFQRFTHRYCYPKKVFIDPGAQLVKGVAKSEFSMADITRTLNGKSCSIKYEVGPTAAHNYQGCVERSIKEIKTLFNATFHGLKLDVMSYETAFSYIANEINNMPICTVSRTEDIGHADLITPNRLIHGRNNRRAPTGPMRVEQPSRLLEQMERLYQSWWQIWLYERLPDYIPKPKKFGKTGPQPKEGDIVVFLRAPDELIGDQLWRLGQVAHLIMSEDGVIRQVVIRWRKHWKEEFHETRRSVRHIAILFSEDELSLVDHIRSASAQTTAAFIMNQHPRHLT